MTESTGAAWGVDGCKGGWFFFRLPLAPGHITFGFVTKLRALFDRDARTAEDRLADTDFAAECDQMLVDMPIGLPTKAVRQSDLRECDREARDMLRPRWQSVFPVPVRSVVENRRLRVAASWGEAQKILKIDHPVPKKQTGRLTAQSFAILAKIREVDDLLTSGGSLGIVRETHPEICFLKLVEDDEDVKRLKKFSKRHGLGFRHRVAILKDCHPGAKKAIIEACERFPHIASDDIVDAMACAVVATVPKADQCQLPKQEDLEVSKNEKRSIKREIVYASRQAVRRAFAGLHAD